MQQPTVVSIEDFPIWSESPPELRVTESTCGPLAVWQILRYFGVDAHASDILSLSHFDENEGAYTVGLAMCLMSFGVAIDLYSDEDPDPQPIETALYNELRQLGVVPRIAPPLATLLASLNANRVAILLYQASPVESYAHFTPVLGSDGQAVIAPNEGDAFTLASLDALWGGYHICRQAVVASRPPAA